MKIVCFSDSHGRHDEIELPECDLAVFTGDCMMGGKNSKELSRFVKWFDKQPAKHKVMIAGNHDKLFDHHPKIARDIVAKTDITYLQDSGIEIEGFNIWGTPSQPEFCAWGFNHSPAQMEHWYSLIPMDTDILLTHCPPLDILDKVESVYSAGDRVGSPELRARVDIVKPLMHVFGHIHGDSALEPREYTLFVNATSLNERYEVRSSIPYHIIYLDKNIGVLVVEPGLKQNVWTVEESAFKGE